MDSFVYFVNQFSKNLNVICAANIWVLVAPLRAYKDIHLTMHVFNIFPRNIDCTPDL